MVILTTDLFIATYDVSLQKLTLYNKLMIDVRSRLVEPIAIRGKYCQPKDALENAKLLIKDILQTELSKVDN